MKARPNAYLGVCIDDYLYFQHVAQASRPDLEPNEYHQVDVSDLEKDFKAGAWIRLVGHQPSLPWQGRTPRRQGRAPRAAAAGAIGGGSDQRRRIRLTTAWATLIVGVITAAVTLSVHLADGGSGAGPHVPSGHGQTITPVSAGRGPGPSASGLAKPKAGHDQVGSLTTQAPTMRPGYVILNNVNTGDCLDSTAAGYVSTTSACNGGQSQRWLGQQVSGAIYELKNKLTGYCLTGTQTGIYSAACETSNRQQQWRVTGSDPYPSFVHVSDGSCLAEPTPDHLASVGCVGSADQHDSIRQTWHEG
jgi:hypothetical protein